MLGFSGKNKIRRRQVREKRAQATGSAWQHLVSRSVSWPVLVTVLFAIIASNIALFGESRIEYAPNQYLDAPVYARVAFQVPDEAKTAAARMAARSETPSHYTFNQPGLTYERIRADLKLVFQAAVDSDTFEAYESALKPHGWLADRSAYKRLRLLADGGDEKGRTQFETWVQQLPLESQYVAVSLLHEPRKPASTVDYIEAEKPGVEDEVEAKTIRHADIVGQSSGTSLRGCAVNVARTVPFYELRSTFEDVVVSTFKEQPTLVYDQERTEAAMLEAEEAVPILMATYPRGAAIVEPGVIGTTAHELLKAHHAAYYAFLEEGTPESEPFRRKRQWQRVGLATEVLILSIALMAFVAINQRRIFEVPARSLAFCVLILAMLAAARAMHMRWPMLPELAYGPAILTGIVLAIAYPRGFAVGVMTIVSLLVTTTVSGNFEFLFVLLVGVVIATYQLDEIRSRTKLPVSGVIAALAMIIASVATGVVSSQEHTFVTPHAMWSGAAALTAAFIVSALLPFIERVFRTATSLTLLEWRDPTKPLLQLLAREAAGTYNHSLVLGTLAEAACERIGANGLLAQVGALYHDIGKIHKAEYFAENQTGSASRHDNLAPTMSLLIIVGHVKDGIEMAKEYKLPRLLHQFIEEHHGTSVVRYFHHVASEKQPKIASGKHDREVPEAEFRYGGPKPRSRESAVLMMCDGVEGAVRAAPEPTPGRIETIVHKIITDRLNDGQFNDCDITLREIHQVEESLVKTLSSIYHGRVAYPAATKRTEESESRKRVSV